MTSFQRKTDRSRLTEGTTGCWTQSNPSKDISLRRGGSGASPSSGLGDHHGRRPHVWVRELQGVVRGDLFGNTAVITQPRYADRYDALATWRGDGAADTVYFRGMCVVVLYYLPQRCVCFLCFFESTLDFRNLLLFVTVVRRAKGKAKHL